ncbi:MAG: hypothetical protein MHMPM18_005165 [Marteilia pararefringens]
MSGAQTDNTESIADKPQEKISMSQNPEEATGIKHAVNPGKSTMQRVEDLGKFEELYKMLSAIKRENEMEDFAIPPEIYIRSDLAKEEKKILLQEDKILRISSSLDDDFPIHNTFISKAVIREAKKVFLEDKETFLWVEFCYNNMILAVTRSTGIREDPFEAKYFQYDQTYEINDDITNSDIFNAICVSIQTYITNGYIQTEFDNQASIPIIVCFSDGIYLNSPIEHIACEDSDKTTFKREIIGKNYCREFARALQLIKSNKTIEFTTIDPTYSSNFLSFYCFETFDEDKIPAASCNFMDGFSFLEFLDCKEIEDYELEDTDLTKIFPDSVSDEKDSKSVIVLNYFDEIGQNIGFGREVISGFLTQHERNYFDQLIEESRFQYSKIASPFGLTQLLQAYIRNHPLFLDNEKLEEKPIVNLERLDYFLQEEYKDH